MLSLFNILGNRHLELSKLPEVMQLLSSRAKILNPGVLFKAGFLSLSTIGILGQRVLWCWGELSCA